MQGHGQAYLMPSYYFNERFYIVYNINLIMFYDLLIFIFMSYIKPQQIAYLCTVFKVVYRTIPTSNHNSFHHVFLQLLLYIVLFLHQTTTVKVVFMLHVMLYIVLFLHQTTTKKSTMAYSPTLYIVLFLHQTTTGCCLYLRPLRCISYYSYIKPQL